MLHFTISMRNGAAAANVLDPHFETEQYLQVKHPLFTSWRWVIF